MINTFQTLITCIVEFDRFTPFLSPKIYSHCLNVERVYAKDKQLKLNSENYLRF